ncbi:hypothetical protein [Burkholderia lata]|uniref:hypothetical protein n=1 Tax=Burkholderia lata (strain ATCC 17760 / DSM 23089 / LMG 22485 / NCIMB 9086 / R18194 / 383) TaxID=482957 RepID=UPI0015830335|nr:hypothetical protein [Burkholderia lata]
MRQEVFRPGVSIASHFRRKSFIVSHYGATYGWIDVRWALICVPIDVGQKRARQAILVALSRRSLENSRGSSRRIRRLGSSQIDVERGGTHLKILVAAPPLWIDRERQVPKLAHSAPSSSQAAHPDPTHISFAEMQKPPPFGRGFLA